MTLEAWLMFAAAVMVTGYGCVLLYNVMRKGRFERRCLGNQGRPDHVVARELMELIVDEMMRQNRPRVVQTSAPGQPPGS